MEILEIAEKIAKVKKERNILLLAHSYQPMVIQQMADIVGDSLELSKIARDSEHEKIMFAAVYFMAETASILSPTKKIMIANKDAGCPLADGINAKQIRELKKKHPGVPVVCYINSTAETKSEVDVICTSSNALKICKNLPGDELIFIPDMGLGSWIAEQIDKKVILWEQGNCPTHWEVPIESIKKTMKENPSALMVVHPESHPDIRALADHICGTAGMIKYVKENPGREFIIGTEMGMKQRLQHMFPEVKFYKASTAFLCPNMKKTTPEILLQSLENEETVVRVEDKIAEPAKVAINRMYELSN